MQAALENLYPAHIRPRLINAVKTRTSCRAFAGGLDAAEYAALSYAMSRYQLPGARLALIPVEDSFFTGTLLGTRRISGCRMIAAVVSTDAPLSRIYAGILGESFVLEATAMGLGTCWSSGSFKRKELHVSLAADEAVLCVIAVGKPAEPLTPPATRHRKAPEHFCRGNFHDWPDELTDAAALVQAAPSAMNMQPWALWVGPKGEFVLDATDRAQLDAGIALCHAELALETPHTWHFGTDKNQPVAWAIAGTQSLHPA